jgi:hypothetical protein
LCNKSAARRDPGNGRTGKKEGKDAEEEEEEETNKQQQQQNITNNQIKSTYIHYQEPHTNTNTNTDTNQSMATRTRMESLCAALPLSFSVCM